MKTNCSNSLRVTLLAALALGAITVTALAGPGPQYWNKVRTAPAIKPTAASKAKCEGCKTTTKWTSSERAPAGKGVPGAKVAGTTHTCKTCAGNVVTEKGKAKDTMVHNTACGPLLCCR